MRLNDSLTGPCGFTSESRQYLTRIIRTIREDPPPPTSRGPEAQRDPDLERFYDTYYVPPDDLGQLPRECYLPESTPPTISSYEAELIEHCIHPSSQTRICVLHGHTGVGKSTLLRRIVYYLYPRFAHLQATFCPVYVKLTTPLVSKATVDALRETIFMTLHDAVYGLMRDRLRTAGADLLRTLNVESRFGFVGYFSAQEAASVTGADPDEWLKARFPNQSDRRLFVIDLLALLNRQGSQRTIMIIDDVDRHSRGVHAGTFLALDSLASVGIASIVSMRTSTYRAEASQILENHDLEVELVLLPSLIERILLKRIENVPRVLSLTPKIPFRVPQLEDVPGEDVAGCLCDLIAKPAALKALVTLSNTNLKSMFLKLELMAGSDAFSDRFIVAQLLKRAAVADDPVAYGRLWIFYHLLLGNRNGTFATCVEMSKAGLVNVFESTMPGHYPWRHFVRLHILMYLYKRWRMSREENEYVSVNELYRHYYRVFENLFSRSLIFDALYALIRSELVFMESCRKYKNREAVVKRALPDSVRLSDAGRFYLENLLHKVEYLYFVKDDIDWWGGDLPVQMRSARREHAAMVKFRGVLAAVGMLLRAEYDCLARLRSYWEGKDGEEEAMTRYRDLFSPYGLPEGFDVSYCAALLKSYKGFMDSRRLGDEARRVLDEDYKKLTEWKVENDGIAKAYISQR
jgi:hypothetical protein